MCGLAGIVLKDSNSVDERTLRCMAERLSHRGPDNLSFVVRDNAGFAHTRLSILDVSSAGHQPMYNER